MKLEKWVAIKILNNQHGIDVAQSEQTWLSKGQVMQDLVGHNKEFRTYCVAVGNHWKALKEGATQSDLKPSDLKRPCYKTRYHYTPVRLAKI